MHSHEYYGYEHARREWQNPEEILGKIGLKAGLTFMDIGCGDGYFTLPAARIVGKDGKVYGVDVNPEAIGRLKKQAAKIGFGNFILRVGTAEETIFCEACVDIIFYSVVLHDFEDPAKVLANARKMIKPEGRLVDLDWKKEPMEIGPPLRIRFSEEQATKLITKAGFRIASVESLGHLNYLVVAQPIAKVL